MNKIVDVSDYRDFHRNCINGELFGIPEEHLLSITFHTDFDFELSLIPKVINFDGDEDKIKSVKAFIEKNNSGALAYSVRKVPGRIGIQLFFNGKNWTPPRDKVEKHIEWEVQDSVVRGLYESKIK